MARGQEAPARPPVEVPEPSPLSKEAREQLTARVRNEVERRRTQLEGWKAERLRLSKNPRAILEAERATLAEREKAFAEATRECEAAEDERVIYERGGFLAVLEPLDLDIVAAEAEVARREAEVREASGSDQSQLALRKAKFVRDHSQTKRKVLVEYIRGKTLKGIEETIGRSREAAKKAGLAVESQMALVENLGRAIEADGKRESAAVAMTLLSEAGDLQDKASLSLAEVGKLLESARRSPGANDKELEESRKKLQEIKGLELQAKAMSDAGNSILDRLMKLDSQIIAGQKRLADAEKALQTLQAGK